jgi:hypothetical protein
MLEVVRRISIDSGNDEHRLAREGNVCTLNSNKGSDHPVPIGGE